MFSDLVERLRALIFRRRLEREMDEELRFHVERETRERVSHGMSPADARRTAGLALGGVELVKEDVRDARGVRPLEDVAADARYGLRALRRNAGFTAAAIVVLGLGIGATTAVFTVMDAVLLSDLPYPDASRLVRIYQQNSPSNRFGVSAVEFFAVRDQQRSFDAVGAVRFGDAAWSASGPAERLLVARATAGFYQVLGVSAEAGRLPTAADEAPDAAPVVVVSHALAERTLGGATAAVARSVTIDGVSHTVIGVLPPAAGLAGMRADAWPVLNFATPQRRGPFSTRAFGRLRADVPLPVAARDLAGISRRIFPLWVTSFQDSSALLTPVALREVIIGTAHRQIGLFAAAVVLVLLIAIANVATLALVRASARKQELSVRTALGATRARIVRLVLTENVVLTLLAGVAGLGVAAAGTRLIVKVAPNLPRASEISLGGRGVLFALLAAAVSGLLVGVSPVLAVLSRRVDSWQPADGRRAGTNRRTNTLRGLLVMAEFALALPLLLGAGLLLNSFLRLQRVDPGFDPVGVVSAGVALPSARYPDTAAVERFWDQAIARLEVTPGVVAAGLSSVLPPDNGGSTNNFDLVDHPVPTGASQPVSPWSGVTSGFFHALGVPLVDGRLFTFSDSGSAPPVVLVSRSWAARFFPEGTPVGRQLISGGCTACPRTTIVGVVGDVKYEGLAGSGEAVYEPVTQAEWRSLNVVVRSRIAPAETFRAIRDIVGGLDQQLPIVETVLTRRLAASLSDPRRWTSVLGAFAAMASALAALGVFGLMSYVVRQRQREIGVRIALGAEPASVTRLIVGRGMRYALIGTGVGFVVAFLEARWLRNLLFGVTPNDPGTLAAGAATLLLAALLACWLPGRRAARIRPVEAIAAE